MPEEPKVNSEPANDNNFESNAFDARTEPAPDTTVDTTPTQEPSSVDLASPQPAAAQPAPGTPFQPQYQVEPSFQSPPQPQVQPVAAAPAAVAPMPNNPMTLVLQWLTYAFWGWTALSLSVLTWISIHFYFNEASSESGVSSTISYPLAAVLVLFAISFVCDSFYSKREPAHKVGAAMVIMVIHAVIFALFGIGWVISAVFGAISLGIGPEEGDSTAALTTIITGVIISLVYGASLLRTIRPPQIKRVRALYAMFMGVITIVVALMGIFGPVMNARETKDDRLIEQGIGGVARAVNDYADENGELPSDLAAIKGDTSSSSKELIDRSLVEYTPGEQVVESRTATPSRFAPTESTDKVFNYELCVTYKAKKDSDYSYASYEDRTKQTTPDAYYHDAGRVCYDLVTDYVY